MDHKQIQKAVIRSQHCQRNWDLSKQIPQEDLDLIDEDVSEEEASNKKSRASNPMYGGAQKGGSSSSAGVVSRPSWSAEMQHKIVEKNERRKKKGCDCGSSSSSSSLW